MRGTVTNAETPRGHARAGCTLAATAAVVASVGDLMMLYVANAGRPELGLVAAPAAVLWIGALLGVVAIPLYVLGYRGAAALVAGCSARDARVIAGAGAVGSILGAVIHGCTALFIRDGLSSGVPAQDPLIALGASPLLVALWAVAALLIVGASISFARVLLLAVAGAPRTLAWMNPALVTILFSLLGSATLLLRSFLVPAAPNLAHVVFFAACARVLRVAGPQRPWASTRLCRPDRPPSS